MRSHITSSTILGRLLGGAGAALLAALALAPASEAKIGCGTTIQKSTKLTSDVTGCPGVGLRIGADDITLDLNGHTVAAAAERNPKAHGIFNEGHDRVVIRGGTVSGFGAYGVRLAGAARNVVEDMRLTGNFTGVGLFQSRRGVVRRSVFSDQRFVGVNFTGGARNRVHDNTITNTAGAGVFIQGAPLDPGRDHTVAANALTGNGILVLPGPRATTLADNSVEAGPGDGIVTFEPSTVLFGNSVSGVHARGIFAPNGALDRGGNRAQGLGLEPACTGVACS